MNKKTQKTAKKTTGYNGDKIVPAFKALAADGSAIRSTRKTSTFREYQRLYMKARRALAKTQPKKTTVKKPTVKKTTVKKPKSLDAVKPLNRKRLAKVTRTTKKAKKSVDKYTKAVRRAIGSLARGKALMV